MQFKAIRWNMARIVCAVVLREDTVAQCGAPEPEQGEGGNHTAGQPGTNGQSLRRAKSEAEQSEKGVCEGQPGKGELEPTREGRVSGDRESGGRDWRVGAYKGVIL